MIHFSSTSVKLVSCSLLWIVLTALPAFSQRRETVEAELTTLDTQAGLTHDIAYSVVQGPHGFMWFGTQSSIDRFDGFRFHRYQEDTQNPHAYAGGAGSAMLIANGYLWIASWGHGLARFNFETNQFKHYRHDPQDDSTVSGDRIQSLYQDGAGNIWAGTFASGLNLFDPQTDTFTRFRHDPANPDSLGNERVWTMVEDQRGRLWLGTDNGLDSYNPKTGVFRHFRHNPNNPNSIANNTVRSLIMDRRGKLWVGTANGVTVIDPENDNMKPFPIQRYGKAKYGNVRTIIEDSRGHIWFGTYRAGLIAYEPEQDLIRYYQSEPELDGFLSHYRIESLFEDRAGVLWIATNGGGIKKLYLSPKNFKLYRKKFGETNSPGSNRISTIYQDRNGILWVGAFDGGLDRIDRKSNQFTHLLNDPENPNSLVDNNVRCVIEGLGHIWTGTYNRGIQLLDPKEMVFTTHFLHNPNDENSLGHSRIRVLFKDSLKRIWVGTEKGVDLYDPAANHFKRVLPDPRFPKTLEMGRVLSLFEDRQGRMWVGSRKFLTRFNPGKPDAAPRIYNQPKNHDIYAIHQDRGGSLWLGGMTGLQRFDPEKDDFVFYPLEESKSREIYGITEDSVTNLWISTSHGLIKFNRTTGEVRVLLANDGIQGNTFNRGAFFRAHDGEMFFGGANGLTVFYPHEIRDNLKSPNVIFNEFKVFNQERVFDKPLHLVSEIDLHYAENMFSLSFAALDYASPQRNQFVYQLEGFDKDWIPAGKLHQATYTNLDPGVYRFRVKGSNSDGIWSVKAAEMDIRIIPPFWRTTWFMGLSMLIIGLIVAWRIWEIRSNTRLLELRVMERTQSLKRANEELARTAAELRDTQKQLVSAAHQAGMAAIAGDVLHNLGNALNSLNVSSDQLREDLHNFRLDFFQRIITLLRERHEPLSEFLTENEKGQKIPLALKTIYENIEYYREHAISELNSVQDQLDYIKNIVKAQEEYAGTKDFYEEVYLTDLIEDAIRFQGGEVERLGVEIHRHFVFNATVSIPKRKLMQIIRHLLKNALEAMEAIQGKKLLILTVKQNESGQVRLEIADTGIGIPTKQHTQIFNHGMTTKPDSSGFGLHFCANALNEIGGRVGVKSKGDGQGATFIVELPIRPPK